MSDELQQDDEFEAHHRRAGANEEPAEDGEAEVEAHHRRAGMTDEPAEDEESEVEAHVRYPNARMD